MRRLVLRGYRVINYDSRGHGESDWSPSGDYSIRALASDLKAILAKNSGMVLVERFGRAWDATIAATRDKVKAEGQLVTVLSGSAYDEVLKKLEPVTTEWTAQASAESAEMKIGRASAKSIDAAPLVAAARQLAPRPR